MYCIKCGKKLPDDAQFCARCGSRTLSEEEDKIISGNYEAKGVIFERSETSGVSQIINPEHMEAPNDRWLWMAATMPMAVGIVAALINRSVDYSALAFAVAAFSYVFCGLDYRNLHHKPRGARGGLLFCAILITPFYLFFRGCLTKKKVIIPGVVWCGLFIVYFILCFPKMYLIQYM